MKKFFTALIGGTVVLIGMAMLILPGPGILVIVAGLAILATEFLWARHALHATKNVVAKARRKSGLANWWQRLRTHTKPQSPS